MRRAARRRTPARNISVPVKNRVSSAAGLARNFGNINVGGAMGSPYSANDACKIAEDVAKPTRSATASRRQLRWRSPGCFGVRGGLESSAAGDLLHHEAGGDAKAQVSAAEATGHVGGGPEEVGEGGDPPVGDRHVLVDAPDGVPPVDGDEEQVARAELEDSTVGVGPGGELGQIRGGDVDLGDVVAVVAEGEEVEAGDLSRWAEDHLLSAADLREEVVGEVVMERGEVVAGAEPEIDGDVLVLVDEGGKTDIGPELGEGGLDGELGDVKLAVGDGAARERIDVLGELHRRRGVADPVLRVVEVGAGVGLGGADGAGADFLREVVVGPPLPRGPALHRAGDDHRAVREEEALLELPAARALHPRHLERAFEVEPGCLPSKKAKKKCPGNPARVASATQPTNRGG